MYTYIDHSRFVTLKSQHFLKHIDIILICQKHITMIYIVLISSIKAKEAFF